MNVQTRRRFKTNAAQPLTLSAAEELPGKASLELGAIDGSASIQRALSAVIQAVAAGTLDPARARVLLYGLQIAATNARHMASNVGVSTEETERPEKKTTDVKHPATTPTASKPHEPQRVRIDEHAQKSTKSEDTAAIPNHHASAEVEKTVTPTQPTPHAGHLRIPPSCFSPANDYSNGARDRLLAARERARVHLA
jgi:hypothetical protein